MKNKLFSEIINNCEGEYGVIPKKMILDKNLTSFDLRIYAELTRMINNDGKERISAVHVAVTFDVTEQYAGQCFKRLRKAGWIYQVRDKVYNMLFYYPTERNTCTQQ